MKWTAKYATGIELIDQQHKLLFRMSEDYRETLKSGRGERTYDLMLTGLHDYATAHFGFEEQCMLRHRCPAAAANSAAHLEFIAVLEEFRQRYAASGFSRADARRLVEFVDNWLASHIGRIDVQLKDCVDNPPSGAAPGSADPAST